MTVIDPSSLQDAMRGILLGTAVGDSVGLPAEGVSRARVARLFPGPWRQRLILGRGMISDDTEHALFVAQALLAANGDEAVFSRALAWKLRFWLLGLPAGIGLATLRAIGRLWLGLARSGVYSAGNGPGMRAGVLGGAFAHDPPTKLAAFVRASSELTHTDPRATTGALAIAVLIAWQVREKGGAKPTADEMMTLLAPLAGPDDREWPASLARLGPALAADQDVAGFAADFGLERGVTGYIYHTVPVAIYAWLRHYGDFQATLENIFSLGGDTDSVGAVAGALAGATVGETGIPPAWIAGICEWPRSTAVLVEAADRLATLASGEPSPGPVRYFWPGVIPRNIFFLLVVLGHGLRRLAPPY